MKITFKLVDDQKVKIMNGDKEIGMRYMRNMIINVINVTQ